MGFVISDFGSADNALILGLFAVRRSFRFSSFLSWIELFDLGLSVVNGGLMPVSHDFYICPYMQFISISVLVSGRDAASVCYFRGLCE